MRTKDLHAALHERVARQMLHDFRGLEKGAKADPMRTLAERYGVSLVTAREALLLLAREGWVELRHGSGCYVRRSQAPDRHVAILVELDILRPGTSPYFLTLVNRLRHCFSRQRQPFRLHVGFAVEPEDSYGDPTCHGFLEDVEADHVSGVVAVATLPRTKLMAPLRKRKIPIVGMDMPGGAFDASVSLDYSELLSLGARTLIGLGCKRLAMVGSGYAGTMPEGREPGVFEQTLARHGLTYRPEWMRTQLLTSHRGAGWDDLHELWNARAEKPDGLLIADDMLLSDVDLAIRALRIQVPRQLKVVLATSRTLPHNASFPLTRLENDPDTMADKMAELLGDLMAGRTPSDRNPVFGYKVAAEAPAPPMMVPAG